MVKLEWGAKHLCTSCGGKFYDLQRNPIVCPKCRTVHTPEESLKARSERPAVREAGARAPAEAKGPTAAAEDEEPKIAAADKAEEAGPEDETLKADKGEDPVEDASELSEQENEVAQVVDTGDNEAR